MPINLSVALGAALPVQEFSWSSSDVQLYSLGLGAGARPTDAGELRYLRDGDPQVLPTFATVAATFHDTEPPKVSFPGVEIDLAKVVHGSQEVKVHAPIPASGKGRTTTRIAEVWDKGKAAVIVQESVTEDLDGNPLWTARSSIFARGEGGFGGERGPSEAVVLPDRDPDAEFDVPTLPQQALLYRLCGDRNPLHSDPEFAKAAGSRRRFSTACAPTARCASRSPTISSIPTRHVSPGSAPSSPASCSRVRHCAYACGRAGTSSSPLSLSQTETLHQPWPMWCSPSRESTLPERCSIHDNSRFRSTSVPTGFPHRRAGALAATAVGGWTPAHAIPFGSSDATLPAPPSFPEGIDLYQQAYQNWSKEIMLDSIWTCAPNNADDVVRLTNWAHENGYTIRPRGAMHGWTPLTIVNGAPVDRVILADTMLHLNSVSVNPGGDPATVTAGPGATLDAITSHCRITDSGSRTCPHRVS